MAMPAGKKRYQITLSISTVERFQKIARQMKMPQGTMSLVLDDALDNVTTTMERLHKKGTATFADLFQMMGETLDEAQKEVARDAKAVSEKEKAKGR